MGAACFACSYMAHGTDVTRLRRKIERDPANPELIKTVWGGGYLFTAQEEPGP